ncbi:MAG: AmmeMemoRadiSam system radical SAM enzyme [Clostridiales bacterium]|jgi:pyruvate formate lyase activating enzyme|nr:AmmeMemoRadiSam system radical SAM enzyme [Clostridiales bacterium]
MRDDRIAAFWEALEGGAVSCALCPHGCKISPGLSGLCGVRRNDGGALTAAGYGLVSSAALDPIEKKPLARYKPGAFVLSVGGIGCNMRCPYCQNSAISMEYNPQNTQALPPEGFARLAVKYKPQGNIGAAYTYNEPFINYEYLLDCAALVKEVGLDNVVVTNGFINPEPFERILPYIDAINIDLKGFTEDFYKKLGGSLEPVKKTIATAAKRCHVEIAALIILGENENDAEALADWLASIDPAIPLHLNRFFPRYKYAGREPTPRETILRLAEMARGRLKYVYAGNMG